MFRPYIEKLKRRDIRHCKINLCLALKKRFLKDPVPKKTTI